jgi:HEAT repeat protein
MCFHDILSGQEGEVLSHPNINTLIIALRTEDRRAHTLVVDDLVKIGTAAVEPLLAVLDDPNPNVRSGAARALGKIGDTRALGSLIFRLRYDPDSEVRKSSVWALHMGRERSINPLIEALNDPDEWVRFGAVIVLSKFGDAAIAPLCEALRHSNPRVRANAAETLGRIGQKESADALAFVLEDMNEQVWQQVAVSMGRMGDARAVNPLIAIVKDKNSDLRTKAIRALGQVRDVRAVETLMDVIYEEQDRWMRLFAIEALGHIGDIRAIEVLLDVAYEDSRDMRTKAIVTLGDIQYSLALDALNSLIEDIDVDVEDQQTALFELGKRHDARAIEGLVDLLLYDPQADTRIYAALVLGEMDDQEVVDPLIDALNDDVPDVANHAMQALVKMGNMATVPLVNILSQSISAERRIWVVRTLGEIANEDAISALSAVAVNGAEQWWVREEAQQILKRLGYDTDHA